MEDLPQISTKTLCFISPLKFFQMIYHRTIVRASLLPELYNLILLMILTHVYIFYYVEVCITV